MKAIKVFIDEREQFKMLNLIEKFNDHEDIVATGTGQTDFVVATSGECAMAYVRAVLAGKLDDCTIETIK
jgi:hypothetical protein